MFHLAECMKDADRSHPSENSPPQAIGIIACWWRRGPGCGWKRRASCGTGTSAFESAAPALSDSQSCVSSILVSSNLVLPKDHRYPGLQNQADISKKATLHCQLSPALQIPHLTSPPLPPTITDNISLHCFGSLPSLPPSPHPLG